MLSIKLLSHRTRFLSKLGNNQVVKKQRFANATTTSKEATPTGSEMILNFSTPYTSIYKNKVVESVILPGEAGEFGVTVGHSPLIAQLAPGMVTVVHTNGSSEQYFIPGGYSIIHANSVTDLSVTEAFSPSDFSPEAVKAGYEAASKADSASSDDITKATAEIQLKTYSTLARALGISV